MTDRMCCSFVDRAERVLLPNLLGMALHADGAHISSKPHASGSA